MSVGHVEQSGALLKSAALVDAQSELLPSADSDRVKRLAEALRLIISAVKLQPGSAPGSLRPDQSFATAWLAESYHRQARSNLRGALEAAESAVKASSDFSFAWARLAELQFSVGLLNITDQDYRLNPLNLRSELPRERTFVARLRFDFDLNNPAARFDKPLSHMEQKFAKM